MHIFTRDVSLDVCALFHIGRTDTHTGRKIDRQSGRKIDRQSGRKIKSGRQEDGQTGRWV